MTIVVEWGEKQLRLSQPACKVLKKSSEKMAPDITAI
jgi:hypothetical protein